MKNCIDFIFSFRLDAFNADKNYRDEIFLDSLITKNFKADRGPRAMMLEETNNSAAMADLLKTWETVDKVLPLLKNDLTDSNPLKRTFSSIITIDDSEDEEECYKQPRLEPNPPSSNVGIQFNPIESVLRTYNSLLSSNPSHLPEKFSTPPAPAPSHSVRKTDEKLIKQLVSQSISIKKRADVIVKTNTIKFKSCNV